MNPGLLNATLVRSKFHTELDLGDDLFVVANGILGVRRVVPGAIKAVLDRFAQPTLVADMVAGASELRRSEDALLLAIQGRGDARLLIEHRDDEAELMRSFIGRRVTKGDTSIQEIDGDRHPAWRQDTVDDFVQPILQRRTVVFAGACEVEITMDLVRGMARRRGLHLRTFATSADDDAFVADQHADAVILGVGPMVAEVFEVRGPDQPQPDLHEAVDRIARRLQAFRRHTDAPILVHNVAVPTTTPLGLADRGPSSFSTRARTLNLQLARVAEALEDVYVVDIDGILATGGKRRLMDEMVTPWGRQGSLTALRDHWLRGLDTSDPREGALAALEPNDALDALGSAQELELERRLADEYLALLETLWGLGRKKLVICDLDNTLWPGVLADTGAPFSEHGPVHDGLITMNPWLGIHQALRCLMLRGVLLACCSKNDEAVVRRLWRFSPGSADYLIRWQDMVAHRVNWDDKCANIESICAGLNVALDATVMIDDDPIERDHITKRLPEVLVLGENLFTVRSFLLTAPQLQVPTVTKESEQRAEMIRAGTQREHARHEADSERAYLDSLELKVSVGRVDSPQRLPRIHELITRTNQFNTTALRLTKDELASYVRGEDDKSLYAMTVDDRFGSHGLVGVCLATGGRIEVFVMSCRVIGLGVERVLLSFASEALQARFSEVTGQFVPTDRNTPARNLFRDNGFTAEDDGWWRLSAIPELDGPHDVERVY